MRTLKMDGMEKIMMGMTDLKHGPFCLHQVARMS
jgi:hypothetical protein